MVSRLTLNFISLFEPLLTKAFGFLRLADRTIPLSSILQIKWMSLLASGFPRVNSANRVGVFERVLSRSNKAKVGYLNTTPIFTDMINYHSLWDFTPAYIVSNTMSPSQFFAKVKASIAISVKKVFPNPATLNLFACVIESFNLLFGNLFHIEHYTPSSVINKQYV